MIRQLRKFLTMQLQSSLVVMAFMVSFIHLSGCGLQYDVEDLNDYSNSNITVLNSALANGIDKVTVKIEVKHTDGVVASQFVPQLKFTPGTPTRIECEPSNKDGISFCYVRHIKAGTYGVTVTNLPQQPSNSLTFTQTHGATSVHGVFNSAKTKAATSAGKQVYSGVAYASDKGMQASSSGYYFMGSINMIVSDQ